MTTPATPVDRHSAPGGSAPDASGRGLLELEGLQVYFPIKSGLILDRHVGDLQAVDGVDLSVKRGETLGLVGESGCGKSTLARAVIRIYDPTGGRIRFDGEDITELRGEALRKIRSRMQMIFQDPYASLNPRMTIGSMLEEPMRVHDIKRGKEAQAEVRRLLEIVGLPPNALNRYPHEFSGGQRQRAGIARALAVRPEFVAADEPVSALDVSIQAQIVNLLGQLQRDFGLTYLFIAHDLSVVRNISDRIAVMYLGRIVELSPSADLYREPLHPYTHALVSAVPIADPQVEQSRRRIILRGDVPSPVNPPSGCRFHTRCWLRRELNDPEICVTDDPALREMRPGHASACHFAEELLQVERRQELVAAASEHSSAVDISDLQEQVIYAAPTASDTEPSQPDQVLPH
ncbi:dipeptide ABC transporter ATP-binding protein [soil metagenome]